MQNSTHSRKEIKTFWKNFDKMLLLVHLSLLHEKQLLKKVLFENQQTYANLLLGLMPANYILLDLSTPAYRFFLRAEISIHKQ